jgi:uncharacterized protein HemX
MPSEWRKYSAATAFGELRRKIPTRAVLNSLFQPRCPTRREAKTSTNEGIAPMEISNGRLAVAGLLTAVAFTSLGTGMAYAIQEHMFNARNDLQQAANELQQAEPDKGGHRDAAINLTRQAIDQVNFGIQYAG